MSSYTLDTYDPDADFDRWYTDVVGQWIVNGMANDATVLEVGSATGRMTALFAGRSRQITAVTRDADMLGRALDRQLPGVSWLRADIMDCHFAGPFSEIVCCSVLHEADDPAALLRHLRQWADPDTRLTVSVPNRDSLHRQMPLPLDRALEVSRAERFGVKHDFTADLLGALLRSSGWEGGCHGRMLKPYPNAEMEQLESGVLHHLSNYSGPHGAMLVARCRVDDGEEAF